MRPADGFIAPPSRPTNVDFPAPLGPMTPQISPCLTEMSSASIATTPPYLFVKPEARTSGLADTVAGLCDAFESFMFLWPPIRRWLGLLKRERVATDLPPIRRG